MGNKNDDPNSKVVETTDAQKFAEQMGINLFETSAKENINVEEVTQTNVPPPHPTTLHHVSPVSVAQLLDRTELARSFSLLASLRFGAWQRFEDGVIFCQ